MLNYIWGFMLLMGIAVGVATGNASHIDASMIDSTKDAVSLCITMLGVMSMWTGLMEIAKDAGLLALFTAKIRTPLHLLFPDIPPEHPVMESISSNILANILGLGWAATPMGIKAMKELSQMEAQKNGGTHTGIASISMCTFLILNISSLQLIPVNIIAYRSEYGSVSPSSIIGTAILATTISTAAGILFALCARKLAIRKP